VIGQVAEVNQTSVPVGQQLQPVTMLRLEAHSAEAGRTSVTSVRLQGDEAVGFAAMGDWVEVTGKVQSNPIVASKAVNHTTGAIYDAGRKRLRRAIVTVIVLGVFATLVVIAILVFNNLARINQEQFERQRQEQQEQFENDRENARELFIEQCIQNGFSPDFCEDTP
jgi:hypothetical protein